MYWPSLKQHFTQTLFPGQQENEEVYLVIRQHWFVFAVRLMVWAMFVAILILADYFLPRYASFLLTSPYQEVYELVKSLYLLFLILGLLILWVIYYLNVQIVTNERVVDIDQYSLVHHKISEVYLSRMQDVTAEVKGLFPTFLNYGDVHIQTAGEVERFVFSRIPDPTAVSKLIADLYDQLPPEQKAQGQKE
ncbi:MAG: PH domain-containing protein [Candidatus Doudnabacteria bacterium]|nr:PH domain-containing protein [Candidatus Doudnabacteria bacterium]